MFKKNSFRSKSLVAKKSQAGKKKSSKKQMVPRGLAAMVKKITLKTQETKKTVYVNAERATIIQQSLLNLDINPLKTSNGTNDPETSGLLQNRIGDEVTPVGLSIKFMVTLDTRQSSVNYRFMLIRSAQGDIPSGGTLWTGACNNKQLDPIDTERYTIMVNKPFKITRPNSASVNAVYTTSQVLQSGNPTGMEYGGVTANGFGTKLVNVWVPGYKFGKVLRYSNGGQVPKTYQYTALLIAYSNDFATDAGIITSGTTLGYMDEYLSRFYFKDA